MENKIQNLEINMAELKRDISYIKKSIEQNVVDHKEIISKIDSFVQAADDRFADKKDHRDSMTKMDDIIETIDSKYVSKEAFSPIQKIVYGMVGAILLTILGVVLSLILKKPIL